MLFKLLVASTLAVAGTMVAAESTSTTTTEDSWQSGLAAYVSLIFPSFYSSPHSGSALGALVSAIPDSLLGEVLSNPAGVASILHSEFASGSRPSWFEALPTSVQTILIPNNAEASATTAPSYPAVKTVSETGISIRGANSTLAVATGTSNGTHASTTKTTTSHRSTTTEMITRTLNETSVTSSTTSSSSSHSSSASSSSSKAGAAALFATAGVGRGLAGIAAAAGAVGAWAL